MGSTNGEGGNGSQATYAEKASAEPTHTDVKGAACTTTPSEPECLAATSSRLRMRRQAVARQVPPASARVPAHQQLRMHRVMV